MNEVKQSPTYSVESCCRCGKESPCFSLRFPEYGIRLCMECLSGVEFMTRTYTDQFDSDGSSVYIQLSKLQVSDLRSAYSSPKMSGMLADIELDVEQDMKLRLMLTNPENTDEDLGLTYGQEGGEEDPPFSERSHATSSLQTSYQTPLSAHNATCNLY